MAPNVQLGSRLALAFTADKSYQPLSDTYGLQSTLLMEIIEMKSDTLPSHETDVSASVHK
jgi:hypothetical protein